MVGTPTGYNCPKCGVFVNQGVYHVCGSPPSIYYWPYYQTPLMAYRCPKCRGEFNNWDSAPGEGTTMNYYCPFCGTKKGEYPEVKP